jgi:hypothetical protein
MVVFSRRTRAVVVDGPATVAELMVLVAGLALLKVIVVVFLRFMLVLPDENIFPVC